MFFQIKFAYGLIVTTFILSLINQHVIKRANKKSELIVKQNQLEAERSGIMELEAAEKSYQSYLSNKNKLDNILQNMELGSTILHIILIILVPVYSYIALFNLESYWIHFSVFTVLYLALINYEINKMGIGAFLIVPAIIVFLISLATSVVVELIT